MLRELLTLDDAVQAARAAAGENALLIVASKQSIGGMRLNGYPFRNDKGVAVVGINAQGVPSLTWSTGPGSQHPAAGAEATSSSEPSAFATPAAVGVAEDGIIVGSGVGSEPSSRDFATTRISSASCPRIFRPLAAEACT